MILRFHGHACFEVEAADGTRLCIDPFESGGFGGAVELPPLPDCFDAWLATHEHSDHNAGQAVPSATRVRPPTSLGSLDLEARAAFHDEFGGRLRGGTTDIVRISETRAGVTSTLVHCGDIGERPVGALLEWLAATPIDVLIVPVGGYFTLGPDGAVELTRLLEPSIVVPCHAAEHGVALPQLGSVGLFERRFADSRTLGELAVAAPTSASNRHATPQLVMLRPSGR